jgi:hypothetical protein
MIALTVALVASARRAAEADVAGRAPAWLRGSAARPVMPHAAKPANSGAHMARALNLSGG